MEKNKKKKIKLKEKITKEKFLSGLKKYIILTIANMILAISVVLFLNPLTIVSGGLTGIAITINTAINMGDWLDIILYIGEAILIIISFIFLGKKATLKSLYSAIICPLFTTFFTRVLPFDQIINILYGNGALVKDTSILLMGCLIGGISVGVAVGLAFMVGGSTAGVDIIVLIMKKYYPKLKESVLCFIFDAAIIIAGTIVAFVMAGKDISSYNIIIFFINVMTALISAGTIEAIYMMRNQSVTITIISDKYEEINEYIIKVLDRGCTMYQVFGGYTGKEKKELKTIVSKKQSEKAKEEILKIDPNCFLTMTISKGVFGEGFQKRFTDE